VHGTFYAVEDLRAKLWCPENDKDWDMWDNETGVSSWRFCSVVAPWLGGKGDGLAEYGVAYDLCRGQERWGGKLASIREVLAVKGRVPELEGRPFMKVGELEWHMRDVHGCVGE
jgi:hypothetical protein